MLDESVRQLFKEQIIRNFSEELHMDLLEEISYKELNDEILCSIQRVLTKAYEKGWKDGLDAAIEKLQEELSHKGL